MNEKTAHATKLILGQTKLYLIQIPPDEISETLQSDAVRSALDSKADLDRASVSRAFEHALESYYSQRLARDVSRNGPDLRKWDI